MGDISGYKLGPLPNFSPVLGKWIDANGTYRRFSGWNDIPWGYNERASLSTFAAAFWLAGGIALEEYIESKGSSSFSNVGKQSTRGRCDLYVSIRRKEYILEAKMIWPSLTNKDWEQTIVPKLDLAREDVRRTRAPSGEKKLGLLFVVPYVPEKRADVTDKLIGSFVDFLINRKDICSAWTFPKDARNFRWNKERMYPGTAVLINANSNPMSFKNS